MRQELLEIQQKLRWHEEVRDWISSVGELCAPWMIEQGMAPKYLRFGGLLFDA